jgi:hypothetical protein
MQDVRVSTVSSVHVLCVDLCFPFHFGSFESQANGGAEFLDLKVTLNICSIYPLKWEMNMWAFHAYS